MEITSLQRLHLTMVSQMRRENVKEAYKDESQAYSLSSSFVWRSKPSFSKFPRRSQVLFFSCSKPFFLIPFLCLQMPWGFLRSPLTWWSMPVSRPCSGLCFSKNWSLEISIGVSTSVLFARAQDHHLALCF